MGWSRQTDKDSALEEMRGRGQRHGGHSVFKTPWRLCPTPIRQLKRLVRERLRPERYYLPF